MSWRLALQKRRANREKVLRAGAKLCYCGAKAMMAVELSNRFEPLCEWHLAKLQMRCSTRLVTQPVDVFSTLQHEASA